MGRVSPLKNFPIGYSTEQRIMSRTFEKSKALIREVKLGRKTLTNDRVRGRDGKDKEKDYKIRLESTMWIPHPRTGIYYPKGHEWVMEDIPKDAATFKQTYWLRSSEGTDVDPSTSVIFDHPFLNM